MFEDLSMGKLLLIFLVIVILFGSKKIPDLAQGLGKGIREFKKALKDVEDDVKKSATDDTKSENKPGDKV
jgi:sec-independent protein translocase protein TatA